MNDAETTGHLKEKKMVLDTHFILDRNSLRWNKDNNGKMFMHSNYGYTLKDTCIKRKGKFW